MTDEELQELELLRTEKHQRIQQARAQEVLERAGIPVQFASLLVGDSDEDTDQRTAQFCETYQAAVTEDIRKRLPQQAPSIILPASQRVRRGIQRIR